MKFQSSVKFSMLNPVARKLHLCDAPASLPCGTGSLSTLLHTALCTPCMPRLSCLDGISSVLGPGGEKWVPWVLTTAVVLSWPPTREPSFHQSGLRSVFSLLLAIVINHELRFPR